MTKKQRAELVQTELDKLYPTTPIPLDHTDPYTLMVAVALSAQTTDKKVNQVTPDLSLLQELHREWQNQKVEIKDD
jgi:endonuclease-3